MFTFTIIIIVITCLVSFKGFNDIAFFEQYKFNISQVRAGQEYRNFSSGFLHGDIFHLAFNMFSFWSFGRYLEQDLNNIEMILVYFGSMLLGSYLTLNIHKNEPSYSAIGASGAVSGIIYSAVLLNPDIEMIVFVIPMPGYIFAVLYLVYSIYGMRNRMDNIGHTAHLGGALGGIVFTLLVRSHLLYERPLFIGILGVSIIVLYFFLKKERKF
jgi:membrane associated rhomboid family serine protease